MDSNKFAQMVREFPYITNIFTEEGLSADRIGEITVARGDRNLLEVTPRAWSYDADGYGDYAGHRSFWAVTVGKIAKLKSAWDRSIPYHRNDQTETDQIGFQLLALDRDVKYIVEIHAEGWDHEIKSPHVVIYKMENFDWRKYCPPIQLTQS